MDVPETPLEVSVNVQLDDEAGAAGLAFCSDGGYRHFGFYPTAGRLRLTRFDGPDVLSWTILHDRANEHYRPGKWNTLRVRLEEGKVTCFVNDQQCVEMVDKALVGGKIGLVKFRNTSAEFKSFSLGKELPPSSVGPEDIERIVKLVTESADRDEPNGEVVATLAKEPDRAARVLRDRADELDREASRLRELAKAAHEHHVVEALTAALAGDDKDVDLFRAGLLVARLDNEDVDVEAYARELERMADELSASLPADATDQQKLDALRKYLFDENGFHGSRGDYYHRANSYLNEVLDDREGLPITLSIVYMELARKIGLGVEGVGLPGLFVVRYVPKEGEPQLIDVYEGGTAVSREEAERRVKASTDRELVESDLTATTKRQIVLRMLQNLLSVSTSNTNALNRYLNAALALDGDNGHYHWLRAIVRLRLEDRVGATQDVEWLVEHKPEGVDLARVLEMQRMLRQGEGE
jgi:regulator of sirC expression with transglutaminase-like and TPR domain